LPSSFSSLTSAPRKRRRWHN
jgi:hypothetical protein